MHSSSTTATNALLTLSLLALQTTAHIVLENPRPYIFAEYGPSNPLNPDGSNFPCKIPAGVPRLEIDGSPTPMTVGDPQTLSFTGTAVHGGGSCQLALTPGFEPTAESPWSVIHSIEGGCPVANREGNLVEGEKPDTFEFAIPDGVAPGNYTFAWTWVNRIGALPEFYMNCAPIEVAAAEGSSRRVRERRGVQLSAAEEDSNKKEKRQAPAPGGITGDFPPLFMANLGQVGLECLTTEAIGGQVAISYPNPGNSVSHPEGTENLFAMGCDGHGDDGGGSGSGNGNSNGNNNAPPAAPSSSSSAAPPVEQSSSAAPIVVVPESSAAVPDAQASVAPIVPPPSYPTVSAPEAVPTSSSEANVPPPSPSPSDSYAAPSAEVTTPAASVSCSNSASAPAPSDSSVATDSATTYPTAYPTAPPSTGGGEGEGEGEGEGGVPSEACEHGHFLCLPGGKSFSICTGDIWTAPQPLAENQRCEEGEGADLTTSSVY